MKLLAVLCAVSFAALVASSRVQETSQVEDPKLNCVKDARGRYQCCPEGKSWAEEWGCLCVCMDKDGGALNSARAPFHNQKNNIHAILLLGTCDSKWSELAFLHAQLQKHQNPPITTLLMDVGRTPTDHPLIDIPHPDSTSNTPNINSNNEDTKNNEEERISTLPRATYLQKMTTHAITQTTHLLTTNTIHAVLSIGGSCGTSLATAVMQRACPIGFPKLMVSTMASGDVRPYVGESDITLMYSVVDIAGANTILKRVLRNAAAAGAGMAVAYFDSLAPSVGGVEGVGSGATGATTGTVTAEKGGEGERERREKDKPKRIGVSMFGVTTPCVDAARAHLEAKYGFEVYVFHATGAGGRAMERLVREGLLDGVLDLTTTEVVDEVVGGVLSAGPERLLEAARAGIPQVVSVGACDMVNFGAVGTVPLEFVREKKRVLLEHNAAVTLMRTTGEESARVGEFIGRRLKGEVVRAEVVNVLLPVGGVSMLDVPGQPFYDPAVDGVLFETVERELEGSGIRVVRDERQINDPGFAVRAAEMLAELMGLS
ncbi:UPF0261-domain-containing protein [Aspergillus campestris IBT 28561]|uniref:UPF0261-domain-containing protein n=1 Tax=Aspergillus campestris (strain IBT 28561) TaxID=1392248 RepID=A0A2I1DCD7_ASPC2|nr:UPF0261-domain-containing protein [Aspergillus campestris IBT 28561]PKY07536.1 UPF0261-domain-containing protein [Aspergillus campestris IBT 28561]